MKQYISLSQFPGTTGKYYYSKFFEYYNIPAQYTPLAADSIAESIQQAKQQNIAGISVSMPFKSAVTKLLDELDTDLAEYPSCNTIVNSNGVLRGYNADLAGVEHSCKQIKQDDAITILGMGAMGSMFAEYLTKNGYTNLNICARKLDTWNNRFKPSDVIINCSALGTSSSNSPFLPGQLAPGTRLVIDLAIKDNELKNQCAILGVKYTSGIEFYKQQFLKQFEIYTGIKPDSAKFDEFERQLHEKI